MQPPLTTLFTGKTSDYVAARPGYPPALLDALAASVLSTPSDVADIGAGTGLLTAALLQRGHRVVAVEPNPEMRAACDERLGTVDGYRSTPGRAEQTLLPDASIDLVTAAQAFHWFDVDEARIEALRVLRPHGQVALIWNDRERVDPVQAALDGVLDTFGGAARQSMLAHDDRSKVAQFFGAAFRTSSFPHEQFLDRAGLASLTFSRSYMPRRDSDAGRAAERALHELFDRFQRDDRLPLRYDTVLMLGRPARTDMA